MVLIVLAPCRQRKKRRDISTAESGQKSDVKMNNLHCKWGGKKRGKKRSPPRPPHLKLDLLLSTPTVLCVFSTQQGTFYTFQWGTWLWIIQQTNPGCCCSLVVLLFRGAAGPWSIRTELTPRDSVWTQTVTGRGTSQTCTGVAPCITGKVQWKIESHFLVYLFFYHSIDVDRFPMDGFTMWGVGNEGCRGYQHHGCILWPNSTVTKKLP